MNALAAGFWGAFFGAVAAMLMGSLIAFKRSQHRSALMSGAAALMSALFVGAYLGWLPVDSVQTQDRVLAHVAMAVAWVLGLMLLALLGLLRRAEAGRRAALALTATVAATVAAGWALPPAQALAMSSAVAFGVGAFMLALCIRSARRGDRMGWVAVGGVCCMLVAISGLSWIALATEPVAWPVHAVSALAGIAYLSAIALSLWARFSYLIELREVMAHGPSYDPVTRMRSHAETGQMVGIAFFRSDGPVRPLGVIVVSIGNLYALENLHGRAAVNHALFVCASRLRRCAPAGVEMGRLSEDGFLLLVRKGEDLQRLLALARLVRQRLGRPVALGTSRDPAQLENRSTEWLADLGVSVLAATPQQRPSEVLSLARAMSRTAWSYGSRLAWLDPGSGRVAELPASPA